MELLPFVGVVDEEVVDDVGDCVVVEVEVEEGVVDDESVDVEVESLLVEDELELAAVLDEEPAEITRKHLFFSN